MPSQSKSILITGCSSGFGRLTALHLAKNGWRVFATVRKEADRISLKSEAAQLGAPLEVLICDVNNAQHIRALADDLTARLPALDALLNNAGTAYAGPIELLPIESLRAQFEINVIAQIAVTQAVLPLIRAARGLIVNVSSISGRITSPVTGPYSASKFALEALSDALRVELAPFGVRVVVIEPGSSPTAIWQTSKARALALANTANSVGAYAPLVEAVLKRVEEIERTGFPPQQFVLLVERILNTRRPKARYALPATLNVIILVRKLLPDWIWDSIVRRALKW